MTMIIILYKTILIIKTIIIDEKGITHHINIRNFSFLPNYDHDKISKIITTEDKGIKIIYSSSLYDKEKDYMNLTKTEKYKYPIRHSHTDKDGEILYWTDDNKKGHFGIPKVILIKGTYIYPLNDFERKIWYE